VERCSTFWAWAFTCAVRTKDLGFKNDRMTRNLITLH
jgi:hypothetical protein